MSSEVIRPFKDAQPVSTLTVLSDFYCVRSLDSVMYAVVNLDPDHAVYMIVDTSEDRLHVDADKQQVILVPPLSQGSIEIGPPIQRGYFQLSAHTEGPAFPVALVKWTIRGG